MEKQYRKLTMLERLFVTFVVATITYIVISLGPGYSSGNITSPEMIAELNVQRVIGTVIVGVIGFVAASRGTRPIKNK